MPVTLRHGSQLTFVDGRPERIVDPGGKLLVERERDAVLSWRLLLPGGGLVRLVADCARHPLLGRCDQVQDLEGRVLANIAATEWARPRRIPAVDVPGALPPGSGTAILNLLAHAARQADVPFLRYQGPYPTANLYRALAASFTNEASEELFSSGVEAIATAGATVQNPVEFRPAPHEWHQIAERVWVQLRDGLERTYIDGAAYDYGGWNARVLRRVGDEWHAEVVFAGSRYATRARFDARGSVLEGPLALPHEPMSLTGGDIPRPLREILRQALLPAAPVLVRGQLAEVLSSSTLRWADTGDRAARESPTGIEVHSALGERLAELPAAQGLAAFIRAVEPVAQRLAQLRLSRIGSSGHPSST